LLDFLLFYSLTNLLLYINQNKFIVSKNTLKTISSLDNMEIFGGKFTIKLLIFELQ